MKKNGFTIIELSIYGAILGGLLVVLTTLFTSTLDLQLESGTTTNVVFDSRYIFSRLSYDLGRATSITTPQSLGQEANTLELMIDGASFAYSVNNGLFELTTASGTDALNSEDTVVSDVRFLRLGNTGGKHSIRMDFTVTSGLVSRAYQTTVALR